jgi:3-oxoadipate enol-lactonase
MTAQTTETLDPAMIRLHRAGKGAPVVMLHGLGMDRHAWGCLGALADSFEIVTYDLPGHGETAVPPSPYGIEELSEQLATVLQREGITRAHVVGHDLGGLIAQRLAASQPAMVDRLVLCATTPCFNDDDRATWQQHAAIARGAGTASLLRVMEPEWFTATFVAQDPLALHLMRDSFAACPSEGFALACEALARADLIDSTSEIYARTLVLVGEHDTLAFREAADWLAQSIDGAKLAYVPHAAHAAVLEQPGWMVHVLGSFLG